MRVFSQRDGAATVSGSRVRRVSAETSGQHDFPSPGIQSHRPPQDAGPAGTALACVCTSVRACVCVCTRTHECVLNTLKENETLNC